MSDRYGYEEILEKYELVELKEDYLNRHKFLNEKKNSVGVFGEGGPVIQVLADMFEVSELREILFPADFCIRLQYGESKTYKQIEEGIEKDLSCEEFMEKMQGAGSLEAEDVVFEGIVTVPDNALNNLIFVAATLSEKINDEFLLCNDICVVALSATHMLSMKERSFIKNCLNIAKCYFLCDIEKVHEEEREQVRALMNSYLLNGERCYIIPYDGDYQTVLNSWVTASNISENRITAIDRYFRPRIISEIRKKLSSIRNRSTLNHRIVVRLESAKSDLPKYKEKTVRYIYINYIEGIKTNTGADVLEFYEKLNHDIVAGAREERNVKELQEELPNYIEAAWTEFIDQDLNVRVQAYVDKIAPAVEEYVDEKTGLFLKELLTEEEYEYINRIVDSSVDHGEISEYKSGTIAGNMSLEKKDNITLRKMLPKCLIALGGIAVLSSSILPGALLIAAGYKGNKDAIEEAQREVAEAGKKMNYEYLKEVQHNLEDLMDHIKVSVEVSVEQCYSNIIDTLVRLIRSYHDKTEKLDEEIALANADLEEL